MKKANKKRHISKISLLQKQIAELKQFNDQLKLRCERERVSRAYHSYLTKYSNDLIILLNDKFRFLDTNERVVDAYGYTRKELVGMHATQLRSPEVKALFNTQVKPLTMKNKVVYETIHRRKNGSIFPVEISLHAINVDGKRLYQAVIRDITERKKAERELVLIKEAQFRTLIDNLPGKVFMKDRDLTYIACNDKYAKDLGVSSKEVEGKTDYDFFPTYLAEKYRADDKRIIRNGKTENLEEEFILIREYLKNKNKNKNKTFVNTVKVPIRGESGKVIGVLGFFWDITERKKAEENILNLNKQIEFILQVTKTGIDIIDSNFNIVYINASWQKVYGDPKGQKCYKYFMGNNKVCSNCGVKKALQTKKPVVSEEILAREGRRPIQVTTIPFQNNEGKWFVAEINVDITERKKTEKELKKYRDHLEELVEEKTKEIKESGLKFRTLFDNNRDGIILADIKAKKIQMCNKAMCNLLGYREKELVGLSIEDIHPQNELPWIRNKFNKMVNREEYMAERVPMQTKDGCIFYSDIVASPITLGNVNYIMGGFRDITERMEAAEKVKDSNERLRFALEVSQMGAWDLDLLDHTAVRTLEHDQIFGYTKLAPKWSYEIFIEHVLPDDRERVAYNFNYAVENCVDWNFECRIRRVDGLVRWIWAAGRCRRDEKGRVRRMSGIVQDITERKIAEEALKEAIKLKSSFTSMVSHELRTPLIVVSECVAQMLDGLLGNINEKQQQNLEIAKTNVDRLSRLINNVLDFQKLEAKKMIFDIEYHDINSLIKEVYQETLFLAEKKNLNLILKLDEFLPKIRFDKDRITQVLINLVSNAIKFTEKGSVTIVTTRSDNFVKISVKDTGIGVKVEDIPRLFKQYEQIKRKSGGAGLGLSISMDIIKAHGGAIWPESTFGKGTIIHFTLPIGHEKGG